MVASCLFIKHPNYGMLFLRSIHAINRGTKYKLIQKMIIWILQIRKKTKISQTEFGKKVGLSRQTISGIERGIAPLTWNNYLAIMMFLEANKERCKTVFNDNSQELEAVLAVIHNKNMEECL